MVSANDGGPAFPFPVTNETVTSGPWSAAPGMSLLDYFAGQAIAASIGTYGEEWGQGGGDGKMAERQIQWAVTNAYDVAQAMLAESERRQSAIALARKGSDQTNNQVVAPGGGGGM